MSHFERAKEAQRALEAYVGHEVEVLIDDPDYNDAVQENMSDLLTDLLHLFHFGGFDLDYEIERARANFDEEIEEGD